MKKVITIATIFIIILSCKKVSESNSSEENNIIVSEKYQTIGNSSKTVIKKADKLLLNGVWAENIDDNALFFIENDSIHYFDSTRQSSYFIDLSDNVLSIYYDNFTLTTEILKLSNDSLVYQGEKEIMKLYKRKE